MKRSHLVDCFFERCNTAASDTERRAAFEVASQHLGFRHFACGAHADPLKPPGHAVMLQNYPRRWVRTFSDERLYEIDPVFLYAQRVRQPFDWHAPAFRATVSGPAATVLEEARAFGIDRGYTIPLHGPPGTLRASCSLVPDSGPIDAESYRLVRLMAIYLYEAPSQARDSISVSSEFVLTPRERQCLALAAQGKTNAAIGESLRISEWTVHAHIESAKRRVGVTTRVQAIVHALNAGEISYGDVLSVDPARETEARLARIRRWHYRRRR